MVRCRQHCGLTHIARRARAHDKTAVTNTKSKAISRCIAFLSITAEDFGGFKFGGLYGFSDAAGQFTINRAYSFGASYSYACLNVGVAYLQLNNDTSRGAVFNANGAVAGDNTFLAGRQQT